MRNVWVPPSWHVGGHKVGWIPALTRTRKDNQWPSRPEGLHLGWIVWSLIDQSRILCLNFWASKLHEFEPKTNRKTNQCFGRESGPLLFRNTGSFNSIWEQANWTSNNPMGPGIGTCHGASNVNSLRTREIEANQSSGTSEIKANKSTGTREIKANQSVGTREIEANQSMGTREIKANQSTGTRENQGKLVNRNQRNQGKPASGNQKNQGKPINGNQRNQGKPVSRNQKNKAKQSTYHLLLSILLLHQLLLLSPQPALLSFMNFADGVDLRLLLSHRLSFPGNTLHMRRVLYALQ